MFDEISDVFSSKIRLGIIAALLPGGKSFTVLKKLLQASDGNLGKQLEMLEVNRFVRTEREQRGRRTSTTYFLTDFGREQFRIYVELLERLLKEEG
ncbi:MAG: transcriptional regulator [Lachnospiraceae bacterium]|nr:transcriptional regulator [Lachnospiraceae bacterium]